VHNDKIIMLRVVKSPVLRGMRAVEVAPQAFENLPDCPLCRSKKFLKDVAIVERGAIVTACIDSEHVFFRRRPTVAWFNEFYKEDWDQRGRTGRRKSANKTNNKIEQFCSAFLRPGSRVLDAGAGYGEALLAFQNAGHSVHGLELSAHRAQFLNQNGIPCTNAAIEEFRTSEPFDLIVLHHVFEHLPNPQEVVAAIRRLLKPEGYVYIAVPDLWQEHPPKAIHFVPHLHWYSEKALTRILAAFDLSVVQSLTTKEIQILAVASEKRVSTPRGDHSSQADFLRRLQDQITNSFGETSGCRTIACCKAAPEAALRMEQHTFHGDFTPWALGVALRNLDRLPKRLASRVVKYVVGPLVPDRITKILMKPRSYMLTIQSDGPAGLPIIVSHNSKPAAVWVK